MARPVILLQARVVVLRAKKVTALPLAAPLKLRPGLAPWAGKFSFVVVILIRCRDPTLGLYLFVQALVGRVAAG
jgi:hypothetical protein